MSAPTVKLSALERCINTLNDLSPKHDRIVSAALEELRTRLAAAKERAQRAEAEREKYILDHRDVLLTMKAERDTARAHVETLKARVLGWMHRAERGEAALDDLRKLLEEGT